MLRVSITHTGVGIEQKELEQLQNIFSKTKGDDTFHAENIGLGLVISHRIVQNSGGQIKVESGGENLGATFTFLMQMDKAQALESEVKKESTILDESSMGDLEDSDRDEINQAYSDTERLGARLTR